MIKLKNLKKLKTRLTVSGLALALLLATCLLLPAAPAQSEEEPGMPHQFYGNVYIDGSPASAGTKVEAYVNAVKVAETTVDSQGRYGYTSAFQVPGTSGTVTFRVGTNNADQQLPFQPGGITPLNLTASTTVLTVTTGSGTYVSPTTATLSGTLVSLGADSSATPFIDYGPTTAYEWGMWTMSTMSSPGAFTTPAIGAGSGSPPEGGLTPGQTVHFRAKAVGSPSSTTVYGSDTTYVHTPPTPGGKLIGTDDVTPTETMSPSYFMLSKFTAVASGTMCQFGLHSDYAGNVKCALYADSAGSPGALITAMNTGQAVTGSGWQMLTFTPTAITNGVVYWLGLNIDTRGAVMQKSPGGTLRYKAGTYSTFSFPNPAGSGFTNYDGYHIVAGWAVETAAPAAPTRDCSALTFKWNASAGATKYHLQVNTSADFTGANVFNGEVGNVLYREVTGLTIIHPAGTTYYWRVKAGNTAGWSDWSTSTGNMRCE